MDIEEHYDKIYRYCYMKTRHQQTAEDITQETFLRFFEDNNYREMGKKLAWLYTVARNLCMDYYRKREKEQLTEPGGFEAGDTGGEPADSGEDKVIYALLLRQAVQKLDMRDQELIFLRYVNELSIEDIGKIMEISRFAVYRRLKSCLKLLKYNLEEV